MAVSVGGSSGQSTNVAANQSTVYGYGSVTLTVGSFNGLQSYGRVWIDGQNYDIAGPTSMSQGQTWSWSAGRTFDHDANGYRAAKNVSVEFWVNGTSYHTGSASGGTQGALDYDRKPGVPASCTAVLNSNKSITVTVGNVSSPAGTPTFYVQRAASTDAVTWGAWTDQQTMTSQQYTYSGLASATFYKFRVWAVNSDGTGGYVESSAVKVPAGMKYKTASAWPDAADVLTRGASAFASTPGVKVKTSSGWVDAA